MSDQDEGFVTRRSRRSTAGNRMEAALAEILAEDIAKDVEDDVDFVNDKEEEDIFESDFESTDEETAQQEGDAGERIVEDEEKQARKAARVRLAKATALAHSRQKVTFQSHPGDAHQPDASSSKLKSKRRVSLGIAVDVQTGEVVEGIKRKRQSQRKHTVMNTSETVSRLRKSEAKRAAATPKRVKTQTRALAQDELIARALDNEEGNIVEHRDYLKMEEEKRKRARVVRPTIDGPLIRWISKAEIAKVPVDPPPPAFGSQPSVTLHQTPYSFANSPSSQIPPVPTTASAVIPVRTPTIPPATPPVELTEKLCKNYVVHELGQFDAVPQPVWEDTMEAMFGDHVRWEELRVFVGKTRPLARPKRFCPITGKLARYRDPRTRVPFADIAAYQTITKILAYEYVWSESLGCYISHQDNKNAGGLV